MKRIKNLAKFIILLSAMLCVGLLFGCKPNDKKDADLPITQNYSVSYLAGEGGSVSGALTQTVEYGEDCEEVVANPDVGYKFVKWSDGVTTAERTDKNITADKSVTAVFEKRICVVRYEADKNGNIEGKVTQTVAYDESATKVTAKPNEGYKFVKWSDGVTTAERADKNITASKSVKAIFEKQKFNVSYITDGNGRIEGGATQTVAYNESAATVTAIPNEGYKFIKWSDGIVTAGRTDAYVKSDKTLEAKFEKKKYTLSYQTDGHGYIRGKRNQRVEYGDSAEKVTAIPDNGYKFVKWSDGVTENERQDLNVKKSVEVTAEFEFLFAGGNGTELNPFTIENYQQLINMRAYSDQNYKLANDLDLTGINHEPIFDKDNPFYGNFDGNGKTIDNLTVATDKNYPSLFGFIFGGTVTSLNLSNVNITTTDFNTQEARANYCVGAVAGYSVGLLYDISVDGSIAVDSLTYDGAAIGGLAGMAYNTVAECTTDVRITAKNIQREHKTKLDLPFLFGGLLGVCDSAHVISCNAQGEINISNACYDAINVGGLIGYYFTDRQVNTEIKDSQTNVVITDINGYCHSGGFVGYLEIADNTSLKVSNSSVQGNIKSGHVGGFVYGGFTYGDLIIEKCYVENEIKVVNSDAAGFINIFGSQDNDCKISSCYSISQIDIIKGQGSAWGFAYQLSEVDIINCFSSGSCLSSSSDGGGFAYTLTRCYVERCYSDSKIDSAMGSGAFVYVLINSEMVNCYSQNEFEHEATKGFAPWHSVIQAVRNSKIKNFYYSGNLIDYVVGVSEDSEIENFHCIKNEKLAEKLIYLDRGETPSSIDITVYESREEMFNIAEKLNTGLLEEVWVNQDKDFPKFKII